MDITETVPLAGPTFTLFRAATPAWFTPQFKPFQTIVVNPEYLMMKSKEKQHA